MAALLYQTTFWKTVSLNYIVHKVKMKYSGFQTCVDLEYFTPILFTKCDSDFSDEDIHVGDMMSPCSHTTQRKTSPGCRWHSWTSERHVGCDGAKSGYYCYNLSMFWQYPEANLYHQAVWCWLQSLNCILNFLGGEGKICWYLCTCWTLSCFRYQDFFW